METPIDEAMKRGSRRGAPDPSLQLDLRQVEVPIDHNPDTIIGEGPSTTHAKNAMMSIWGTWNAVKMAAEDPDTPLPTLARVSQQAVERGLAQADRAAGLITESIRSLEASIEEDVCPRQPDMIAAEIRSYWRTEVSDRQGKTNRGKLDGMMQAVRADKRTSAAILAAPPYLSGLDDDAHALVRQTAVQHWAAERQADLEEAERALQKVTAAASRVSETLAPKIHQWANPEPTKLRQLRQIAEGRTDG